MAKIAPAASSATTYDRTQSPQEEIVEACLEDTAVAEKCDVSQEGDDALKLTGRYAHHMQFDEKYCRRLCRKIRVLYILIFHLAEKLTESLV